MAAILSLIASLLIDISFSWARMLIALVVSVVLGLFIGIYTARHERAERLIMPVVDILQTLPILAFFPFVIFVIVASVPGYIGINIAVIFLIVTSMLWNIIFGAYEAVKTLPNEVSEVSEVYRMGSFERLRKIWIPASMPKVVEQAMLSWSIGLFYLVTSEIFSTASSTYTVKYGIGVALTNLALSGNYFDYAIGIAIFVIFVILTRALLFAPLETFFSPYNDQKQKKSRLTIFVRRFRTPKLLRVHWHVPRSIERMELGHRRRTVSAASASVAKAPEKAHLDKRVYAAMAVAAVVVLLVLLYGVGIISNNDISLEYMVLAALAASFARVWLAFAFILIVSVPVSIYLVFMSKHRNAYITLFQVLASIPATILLPLIVLSLKNSPYHNEIVAFVIFVLSGVWYVIFGILSNKNAIQSNILEVRDIFKLKGTKAWRYIYLQAIVPGLITGAVTGIGAEWNASIVAEYFKTPVMRNVTSTAIANGAKMASIGMTNSTASAVVNGTVLTSVKVGMGELLNVQLALGHYWLMALALINLTVMIILINRLLWKRAYNRVAKMYR
jgi:NitT/TauT family transport system permease protein